VAGLDVAQQHDYTALAILERYTTEDFEKEVRLVHLDRWQLPYPDTVTKVGKIFSSEKLAHQAKVVVDATGPGLSFYEDLRRDKTMRDVVWDARLMPMIITAGQDRSRSGRFFHVPKHYLITRLQTAIRKHQIRVPRKLPLYAVLEQEIEGYELKVREGSNQVTYSNNPRDGGPEHDDTILALAMAWWGLAVKQPQLALRLVR
jgi:hypothetical protein